MRYRDFWCTQIIFLSYGYTIPFCRAAERCTLISPEIYASPTALSPCATRNNGDACTTYNIGYTFPVLSQSQNVSGLNALARKIYGDRPASAFLAFASASVRLFFKRVRISLESHVFRTMNINRCVVDKFETLKNPFCFLFLSRFV